MTIGNISLSVTSVQAASSVVIAAVAVLGGLWRKFYLWWNRPQLRIGKQDKVFFCNPKIDLRKDSSGGNEYSSVFFVPIDNFGNTPANHVAVFADCVLKKKGDWDTLESVYFGMPLQFKWRPNKADDVIPGNDSSYFKVIAFVENTKGENSPGAKSEKALICSLCVDVNSSENFQLSIGSPLSVFVHVKYRAQNISETCYDWLYINWDGAYGRISPHNLTIRLASKEERGYINKKYVGLKDGGKRK